MGPVDLEAALDKMETDEDAGDGLDTPGGLLCVDDGDYDERTGGAGRWRGGSPVAVFPLSL